MWRLAALAPLWVALGACASAPPPPDPAHDDEHGGSEVSYYTLGLPPAPSPIFQLEPEPPITLAAVGDIMLGSTYPYPDGRDLPPPDDRPAGLMSPFAELLQRADLAFGNLEGVTVAHDHPLARPKCDGLKKGCFAFRMPPAFAPQLAAAGFDLISMANNHVLDFGEAGREATRALLDELGLAYSGKRGDIARREVRGRKVSMIALSNYDHSYLLNDLADATAIIAAEAAACDILVVSFHGGAEGPDRMRIPHGPETFLGRNRGDLRTFARAAVDAGADLVLGHGPHVPRAIELYQGRLIAYSLGNFATYKRFNLTGPNGLAFVLEVALAPDGAFVSGRAHPLVQRGLGGPEPDPDAQVLPLLRDLSRKDFPETGAVIAPDGEILPPGENSPPMPAPPAPAVIPAVFPAVIPDAPPGARHLDGLHPHLAHLARQLHREAVAAGVPFRVIFGYTPYTRRARPGPGGMATWHQFGLAFDVLIADRKDIGDGKRHFAEDAAAWRTLGAIAERLGLVWGGSWRSSYDPFHFEWHPGDDSVINREDLRRLLALAGPDGKDYRATWSIYPAPSRD